MNTLRLLSLGVLSVGLYGTAVAGTLTYTIDTSSSGDFTGSVMGSTFSFECASNASQDVHYDAESGSAHVTMTLTYHGSTTDLPPSSISVDYTAGMYGQLQYSLTGSSIPSGGVAASYSGDATKGGTTLNVSDSLSVAQTASYQSAAPMAHTQDLSDGSFSNLSWASVPVENSDQVTYTITLTLVDLSAFTSANVTTSAPPFTFSIDNSSALWHFDFSRSSVHVH